ncbi:polyamine aminopropyltransferase [Sagittula sp. M10.9X]|uniref:Polyamine aminopropyltransferase n=1 Tax=Sagittula salina TaxID=2820268 RepID=A0A940MUE5_9RHOB|nr:polyamine aminopropyltransferase [Sagittula salina]
MPQDNRLREVWLLLATLLVAIAGLIYELIAATVSSYLLGDSVRQFSFVIGVFLSAMGLGAWVSRFVADPVRGFIWAQVALGVIGGFLAPVLFFSYAVTDTVGGPLYGALIAIGALSGMEIPLIARVLETVGARRFRFENVLTVDYIGALVASLAFPLFVIPNLGLMSASLSFGVLNLAVALLSLWIFRDRALRAQWVACGLALVAAVVALVQAERLVSVADQALFEDDVILTEQTAYQKISVTRFRDRTRLYLDHSLQFDSYDEYRYHEALVHPAMSIAERHANVLILGGGDGMATREVLRHDGVEHITLVDLDPRMTALFRDHAELAALNAHVLSDPRVSIVNSDAWRFAEQSQATFDVVILDLPDPKNIALSKLYSREFYSLLIERLASGGALVTQSGSPTYAPEAFWSIVATWGEVRNPALPDDTLTTLPYHVYVPSFGDWGFTLVTPLPHRARPLSLPEGLKFLTEATWSAARSFPPDAARRPVQSNTLQTHALVEYYLTGWDRWFE